MVTGLRRGLAFGKHPSLSHDTLLVVHLALATLPFSVSHTCQTHSYLRAFAFVTSARKVLLPTREA